MVAGLPQGIGLTEPGLGYQCGEVFGGEIGAYQLDGGHQVGIRRQDERLVVSIEMRVMQQMDSQVHIALFLFVSRPDRPASMAGTLFLLEVAQHDLYPTLFERGYILAMPAIGVRQPCCIGGKVEDPCKAFLGWLDIALGQDPQVQPLEIVFAPLVVLVALGAIQIIDGMVKIETIHEARDATPSHDNPHK